MSDITGKDIANAAMGRSAVKQVWVTKMPPTRPEMCAGCPFSPDAPGILYFKCLVLKDELKAKPSAVWMCHETADGGARPTEKSILCRGFTDWKEEGLVEANWVPFKDGVS